MPESAAKYDKKIKFIQGREIERGDFLNWMIVKVVEAHLVSAAAVTKQFWRDNNNAEDPSGNEQISIEELSVGLNKCLGSDPKNAMSYAEVSALILELDVNDDGEFDEEEFESWLRRHSAPIAIQGSDFIPFKSCFKSKDSEETMGDAMLEQEAEEAVDANEEATEADEAVETAENEKRIGRARKKRERTTTRTTTRNDGEREKANAV